MIKFVRASIRLILFFFVSFLTVVLVGIGNILLGIVNHRWTVKWKNTVIHSWSTITAAIIGLKINIKGTTPDPPFFLVTNHLSYIDVVPLWYSVNATFIAKSEVKSWPFFGWGTQILGVLFIDRALKKDVKRMNKRISESITEDQGVILFPEGTSTKGATVLPFNAPLLQYAAESNLAVSYATISYRTTGSDWPAHLDVCWWGDMPFFSHFWNLLQMPGFEADITFGDHTITESERKILAEKLHKAVLANFTPLVEEKTEGTSVNSG